MNRLGLFLLGLGHFAVDINPGALPALLPIVFLDLHLSYTTAALVVTTGNVTSSIVQPLFGVLSDRLSRGWLVPLGCLLGTLGLAMAGLAPTYPLLLASVVVSSLGVAVFHPEAVRTANQFAGPRRATGMALFTVGGNFGVALGPILLGTFLAVGGRSGTIGWLAFAAVFPPLLYMAMRRVSAAAGPAAAKKVDLPAEPTRRGALVLLLAVIFFRQWTQTGLTTFIPLYFVTYLREPPALANQLLSALLFGSVVGTLLGGPLADRFGRKPVLSVSLFLTVPLLLLFQRGGPGPLAPLVLFAAGAVMLSTASVVVVMGQELLPRSTGLAAGLTIGFASGLAGLGGVLLGGVADRFGVAETMALVCLLPLPGALLSLRLPDTLQRAPLVPDPKPA